MRRRRRSLDFVCRPEDLGVIAEPAPAGRELPSWLRQLPGVDRSHESVSNNGLTAKRCMPMLDAFSVGWMIPLAATVRLEISDGGRTVNAGWEFDRVMVSTHNAFQVAGNPYEPRPPMKFHNHWTVRTPKGWSCLFLPAVNRPNHVVELLAGVVDTDAYTAPVNFPFFAIAPDGLYTLEKGTPLVQVVPFRRRDVQLPGTVRSETVGDRDDRTRVQRSTTAGSGWYRSAARAPRPLPTSQRPPIEAESTR
ncbi:MAG: DUF6065 family protein [Acidimicrobiia bacterium]